MEQTYKLNMIPTAVPVVVRVSQYDVGLRTITFNLLNGSETYEVPSGSTVTVRGVKTDATAFEYACTYSGSTVTFDIQEQMTVLAGKEICEIRITNEGEILGSANFVMFVENGPINEDTPISETELPLIEQAVQAAAEIIATAETVLDDWMTSEGITIIQNWTQDWLDEHGITYDSALSSTSENAVQNKVITEALETKAEINGYYEDMTVGNALQLISSNYVEDSTPYNFRTFGGSADIGNRNELELVGGSIVWNQLLQNGNFDSASEWYAVNSTLTVQDGYATLTSTSASSRGMFQEFMESIPSGHKVLMYFKYKRNNSGSSQTSLLLRRKGLNTYITFALQPFDSTAVNEFVRITNLSDEVDRILFYPMLTGAVGDTQNVYIAQTFDLTQMFGSTVADYIYSLEQSSSGAGVAYFRKLFPKSYYPYNAGEMMHVVPSEYITTGLNQWDEEWEVGGINATTGNNTSATDRCRSVNYIHCIPNTTYYYKGTSVFGIFYYDADKNFIQATNSVAANRQFTTISDAHYMRFITVSSTLASEDICINLSWSGTHNGEYEPYETHTYSFDNLTLRGIPKVDASGNLYYDGDTYSYDGTVTRKYEQVLFDGGVSGYAFTGAFGATSNGYAVYRSGKTPIRGVGRAISDKFVYLDKSYADMSLYSFGGNSGANTTWIFILPSTVTSVAEANAWAQANPFTVVWQTDNSTIESVTPYSQYQVVNDWGTEELTDYEYEQGNRDVAIPVGNNSKYPTNLVDKLNHLPSLSEEGDGNYVIEQTGTQMNLVRFRIPKAPTTDGTYTLKATVSGGVPTYTWESE